MRILTAISLLVYPQIAFSQEDLVQWNDWGRYQVVGILSSDSLLIIQDSVYFVCDLESESASYAVRNCFPAITDGQATSMQAEAAQLRADADARIAAQNAQVAAKAAVDAAKAETEAARTLALGAIADVSDDQFVDAFSAVLKANGCILELESSNVKNPNDLMSIMVSLGITEPINPFLEEELRKRSLSAMGNLYRDNKLEFGELSKTIKLKECT